jgi:hypothetical protein
MSRITGNDARGLMEAYSAVYTPQELTEEQVWEEVETWVNSLLEEGYDLSDYTWEEMYESYLEEIYQTMPSMPGTSPKLKDLSIGPGGFNIKNKPVNTGISPIFQRPGTGIWGPAAPTAAAPAASRPAAGASARPTATAAAPKPAAAPATTKVAPKPALGPTGMPLVGGIERRLPTRAEMDAAKAYRTPAATTGTLGAATAAATAKPNAFGSSTSAATPAPKPAATPVPAATPAATPGATPAAKPVVKRDPNLGLNARERMRQNQSFDYFDVVKGHLIDEGYADTEEAALVIMANMSEEWRESIVEGATGVFVPSRVDDFNNRRDMLKNRYGQDVGPRIPGPSGGGQYGEPPAPKAGVLKLARGTSSLKRGVESKNNA